MTYYFFFKSFADNKSLWLILTRKEEKAIKIISQQNRWYEKKEASQNQMINSLMRQVEEAGWLKNQIIKEISSFTSYLTYKNDPERINNQY